MDNDLKTAAVRYAEKGFSVLPISDNKRPMVKFKDHPAFTPEEVAGFWTNWPGANIGLRTDKFIVVDVDRNHGGDVDGLQSILDLHHDEWFTGTYFETTRSGGLHFYFAKPPKVKIAQDIGILPGVDIKAHVNNYVIVAPSPGYESQNREPMQPIPSGLLQFILDKQKKPQNGEFHFVVGSRPSAQNKTTKYFETVAHGLGAEGGRNDKLASLIGGLLYRNVDPQTVADLAVIANEHTTPPLPLPEVQKTFDSMLRKEMQRRNGGEM